MQGIGDSVGRFVRRNNPAWQFAQAFTESAQQLLEQRGDRVEIQTTSLWAGPKAALLAMGQAGVALQAATGGAISILGLAAQVGLAEIEPAELSKLRRPPDFFEPASASPELMGVWNRLSELSTFPSPELKIVSEEFRRFSTNTEGQRGAVRVDLSMGRYPAMADGERAYYDPKQMEDTIRIPLSKEFSTFVMAHELAHLENGDSPQQLGRMILRKFLPAELNSELTAESNEAQKKAEFKADRRAAELCAQLDCDPKPVLQGVLRLKSDPDGYHPEAEERASQIRDVMASFGKSVSDADWEKMVQSARGRSHRDLETGGYLLVE